MALYLINKCRFENSFKSLPKGLELFLTEIIHYNQNGFVKWRSVFDAVWTIGDSLGMKIALGSWLLSNLKKQMILLPMFAGYKFPLTGGWYARLVDSPINLWYGPKKEFRAKRCCSTNPCFVIIKWTFLKNFKPLEVRIKKKKKNHK